MTNVADATALDQRSFAIIGGIFGIMISDEEASYSKNSPAKVICPI